MTEPLHERCRITAALSEIEAFIAVVDCASFSMAARRLGLSQPTVSQRVQALESAYGLKLIERRKGIALTLTRAGRRIYDGARQVLARAVDLERVARELGEAERGEMVVGFSTPALAMPVIARLLAAHPRIGVSFRTGNTSELLAQLAACEIDAGVMTMERPPMELRSALLAEQRLLACVPARHAWVRGEPPGLQELARCRLILREEGSLTREIFERACGDAGVVLADVMCLPSRESVKEAVAAGLGVGIVLAGEMGDDRRLASVPIEGIKGAGGVYAVARPDTAGLPLVEAFFTACKAPSVRTGPVRGGEPGSRCTSRQPKTRRSSKQGVRR